MHYDISFPNLGIELEHVGKSVSIFGFQVAYYGIIIGAAILIGFLIATSEAKRTRQNPDDYLDMGIIGVIAGIVGARLYFVIFSWDLYKDNLLDIFNLREGGLAIYGGVIAAVIATFVLARIKHLSPFQILDTIALALLNGQMLGRWGNFFNREAFGEYTDSLFAMRLPLDAVRSGSQPVLTTRQKHTRECFVVAKEGADIARIENEIKTMPDYFADYDTTVHFITQEELLRDHSGIPHGGFVITSGKTGWNDENTHVVEYSLKLDSNPEFTSSILTACARAAFRMNQEGRTGCVTLFDIPPAYLSPKSGEELRRELL